MNRSKLPNQQFKRIALAAGSAAVIFALCVVALSWLKDPLTVDTCTPPDGLCNNTNSGFGRVSWEFMVVTWMIFTYRPFTAVWLVLTLIIYLVIPMVRRGRKDQQQRAGS